MQNAVDALKISFGILVFIVALTITFSCISQIRKTSTAVMFQIDKTNFYNNMEETETQNGGRKVGIETVISTLYRIPKESIEVTVVINGEEEKFGLNNGTQDELETQIKNFKDKMLGGSIAVPEQYIETFSEITTSGKYIKAEDGSQIVETPGTKKVYITYKCLDKS